MSIAVTAVVRPSVRLRCLLAGYAASAIGAGLALACAGPARFSQAWPGAAASALAGLLFLFSLLKNSTPRRIDISGVGQIRLTVYHSGGLPMAPAVVVHLMAASTLWPGWLMLLLRGADGRTAALAVWPDSVAGAAFRPLALACRAIAARHPERE